MKKLLLILMMPFAGYGQNLFVKTDTTQKYSYVALHNVTQGQPRQLVVVSSEIGLAAFLEDDTCLTVIDSARTISVLLEASKRYLKRED